jgi:hypothetical protein
MSSCSPTRAPTPAQTSDARRARRRKGNDAAAAAAQLRAVKAPRSLDRQDVVGPAAVAAGRGLIPAAPSAKGVPVTLSR